MLKCVLQRPACARALSLAATHPSPIAAKHLDAPPVTLNPQPHAPCRYLRSYEVSKKKLPDARDKDLHPSRDSRQHYVYKRDNAQLIRFSDYHPKNSSEAFFYQLLLRKVPFRDEVQLMSEGNTSRSYLLECQLRLDPDRPGFHILHDEDDLNEFVQEYRYCERHMYRWARCVDLKLKNHALRDALTLLIVLLLWLMLMLVRRSTPPLPYFAFPSTLLSPSIESFYSGCRRSGMTSWGRSWRRWAPPSARGRTSWGTWPTTSRTAPPLPRTWRMYSGACLLPRPWRRSSALRPRPATTTRTRRLASTSSPPSAAASPCSPAARAAAR